MNFSASRPPPLDRIPQEIAALADYEPFARERLDDNAWAYLAGGAADGVTQRNNRAAFDDISLTTRILADLSGGSTRTSLFGIDLAHPVMVAPVGYQKLFHPDGERAVAMAAGAMDAPMIVSSVSTTSIEEIAEAADGAPLLLQLYWQNDRGATRALIERAEAAGCKAIVPTADAPINGVRNIEQRAGFRLPPGLTPAMYHHRPQPAPPGGHPIFDGLLTGALAWRDIEWLIGATRLPIIRWKTTPSPRSIRQHQASVVVPPSRWP